MKKIILILFAAALILASCQTLPPLTESRVKTVLVWDETLPKEQSVGLAIQYGLTVTSYNGISVKWEAGTMVYLPPGIVNFTFDASYQVGYTIINGSNWPFEWNFAAGDRRYLMPWMLESDPVILVINGEDKIKFYEQPSYRVPIQRGRAVLQ